MHSGLIRIPPKKDYSQKLFLNEWSEFASMGKYILTVHLANEIKTAAGAPIDLNRTFTVEFYIDGQNTEQLKNVSKMLLQKILSTDSPREIDKAAKELSYIDDPIAIPYLQKAIVSNKSAAHTIIYTFGQKGGKVAVDALIGVLNAQPDSEWVRSNARAALRMIEAKSSDPELKQRIKAFLKY